MQDTAAQSAVTTDHRPDDAALRGAAAAGTMDGRMESDQPFLSIIIKTLNEAEKIGTCLASVQSATRPYPTQIIVADSRSDDSTVQIAQGFGVNVVTLTPDEERGCGKGAQLGFQYATGKYVLLLDGDMELDPAFLSEALQTLEEDPGLAGVGGMVEFDEANLDYRLRRARGMAHLRPGDVDRLDGGGVYRRAAIQDVGYLANQNLHSYEEFELALRLRQAGWRLKRIATAAVYHRGHTTPAPALLVRRWRSHYTDGQGEALRAALGSRRVAALAREFWLSFAVIGWWGILALYLFLALCFSLSFLPMLALLLLPPAVMVTKRRSLLLGSYSVLQWQVNAAGLVRGFLRPQRNPTSTIAAIVMNTAAIFPVRPIPAQGRLEQRQHEAVR